MSGEERGLTSPAWRLPGRLEVDEPTLLVLLESDRPKLGEEEPFPRAEKDEVGPESFLGLAPISFGVGLRARRGLLDLEWLGLMGSSEPALPPDWS